MKLLVTDLDGTLLDEMTSFSDINKQALMQAKDAGYEIVIASGRMRENMSEIGVDIFNPYAIAMNGAIVYGKNKEIIYEKPFTQQQTQQLFSYCEEKHLIYLIYTQDHLFIHLPNDMEEQIHKMALAQSKNEKEYVEHKQFFHSSYCDLDQIDETIKQSIKRNELCIYKMEIISYNEMLLMEIDHTFKDEFSVSCSWMTNRELTAKQVNKGTALQKLCDHLNLTLDDCVAMGDNLNDVEMLKCAGFSIAMENASDEIKLICDYVSCDCNDHGVAKAVDYLLQKSNKH